MLEKVLLAIRDPHIQSLSMIAHKSELTEKQVAEALWQLERLGYLTKEIPRSCSGGCAGCRRHCKDNPPQIIGLTEKGRQRIASKR